MGAGSPGNDFSPGAGGASPYPEPTGRRGIKNRQKAQVSCLTTCPSVFLNSLSLALVTCIREHSVGAKLSCSARLISRKDSKSFLMFFSSQVN
jgi:hypothetical protein